MDQKQNHQGTSLPALSQPSGSAVERFGESEVKQRAEHAAIAVAAEAKAQVEAGFVMAMKNPRNELQARAKILETCKNIEFAQKAIYRKPVAGTFIEGPSVRLAEEIGRQWKNIKIQMATIYEDEGKKIARVMVLDLESNISYDKAITIEKIVERRNAAGRDVIAERLNTKNERVFIVRATEDEVFTKESALTSKTLRNGILRCIPEHIISEAVAQCRATMKAGVDSDPQGAIRKITDFFAKFRILPKDLEEYLGHSLQNVSSDEITDLQAVYNTIRDGEATWSEVMERKSAEENEEKDKPETGNFTDSLKPGDETTHQAVDKPIGDLETKRAEIGRLAKIAFKGKNSFQDWLHAKYLVIKVDDLKDKDIDNALSILRDMVDSGGREK